MLSPVDSALSAFRIVNFGIVNPGIEDFSASPETSTFEMGSSRKFLIFSNTEVSLEITSTTSRGEVTALHAGEVGILCLSGEGKFRLSEPHRDSDRSEKPSRPPVLVFSFKSAGNLYSILEHHLPNLLTSKTSEVSSVSRALQSLAREHDNWADGKGFPSTAVRLLESIVCLMLAEWSAGWSVGNLSHDPRQSISAVLREVYSNPGKKWTLPAMSAIAGMSRSMFVYEFKSSVGEPPMQHLRRWRLALVADSLIVDPTLTLDRLAKKTGYSDAFNLSTAFKTYYGVAPSQYQLRVRT